MSKTTELNKLIATIKKTFMRNQFILEIYAHRKK